MGCSAQVDVDDDAEEEDDEDGDDDGGGPDGAGGDEDDEPPVRAVRGGACYEAFVYAKRTQNERRSAARAYLGQAWYGVVAVTSLECRAPLVPPFHATKAHEAAWRVASQAADMKVRRTRGYYLWNKWMGNH